jgi:hypothetical protein
MTAEPSTATFLVCMVMNIASLSAVATQPPASVRPIM